MLFTTSSRVQLFFLLPSLFGDVAHLFVDNPNLVYSILRANDRLHALATFTLSSALAEIARVKAAKDEHLRRTGTISPAQKRSVSPEQAAAQAAEEEGNECSAREEKDRVRDREETLVANAVLPEQVASVSPPSGLSEKARGKLRARSPSVGSLVSPALGANPNILGYESASGFVATEEWVQSWVQGLPLDSILIATSEVGVFLYVLCQSFEYFPFCCSFCSRSRVSRLLRVRLRFLRQPRWSGFYHPLHLSFHGDSNGRSGVRCGGRVFFGVKYTSPAVLGKVHGLAPRFAYLALKYAEFIDSNSSSW